jgi:hypothetical protein
MQYYDWEEAFMVNIYRLVVKSGSLQGREFLLDKNEIVIGRDTTNDIVIPDQDKKEVSRRHSRLFMQSGSYIVEDLGSLNGTFVNGQRLAGPHVLRPGEIIQLGDQVSMIFEIVQMDPDATVVSAGQKPTAPTAPAAPPAQPIVAPPPVQQTPPTPQQRPAAYPPFPYPPQSYGGFSGQVPNQPEAALPATRRIPTWAVVALIAIGVIVVLCVIPIAIIDATDQWCNLFGDIFNGIQPGACP